MTLRLTYKWKSNKWCVFCSVCGLCSVREVLGFCGVLARLTGATANHSQPPAHPTSAPPCLLSRLPDRFTFFRLRADLKMAAILEPERAPLETHRWCHSLCRPAFVCLGCRCTSGSFHSETHQLLTRAYFLCIYTQCYGQALLTVANGVMLSYRPLFFPNTDKPVKAGNGAILGSVLRWASVRAFHSTLLSALFNNEPLQLSGFKIITILDTGLMEGDKRGMERSW